MNDKSIRCEPDKVSEREKASAMLAIDPNIKASTLLPPTSPVFNYPDGQEENFSPNAAFFALKEANEKIKSGDLEEIETTLANQIRCLDNLFSHHFMRALSTDRVDLIKLHSNIAFKAQRQCRSTAEALTSLKNPKPYIQHNSAQYQQVNNATAINSKDKNKGNSNPEKTKMANGLLEDKSNDGEWLDTRTPGTASGDDKELEALEAKHRPQN